MEPKARTEFPSSLKAKHQQSRFSQLCEKVVTESHVYLGANWTSLLSVTIRAGQSDFFSSSSKLPVGARGDALHVW